MKLVDRLERVLGRFAVPNLTFGIILCQVAVYALSEAKPEILQNAELIPGLVLRGQVWRLISFIAVPPTSNLLFAFFFWYMFFLMGTALEQHWGVFRYNAFLLIGYLATVAASFIALLLPAPIPLHDVPASNAFLEGSVFLAFAFLYPEFVLYIFFVIPVKIKWLAALAWLGYIYEFAIGDTLSRLLVLASVMNFLLFFRQEIIARIRTGRRRMAAQVSGPPAKKAFHRCTVCGITDLTHPEMDFRYCSKCEGTHGYCTEHLHHHTHIGRDGAPLAPQGQAANE